ncbi:phage minor capsid protein [Anaeromassilibacillus senegalensis]|uniref:phage minor capsid protein n=1 Tax=Anaeromassilibacillus senegalensis TaxID=1673717 RepID=UPI00068277D2|nr:phage minor capsid protein [Anaeromassilibacillus senegalensis]
MTWRQIAALFEKIELRLIASLKRNLAAHKRWECDEGFKWPAWQAEKLHNLERFRKENQEILNEYQNVIDEETQAMLQAQFAEGAEAPEESLPEPTFFGVNEPRLENLIEDIQHVEGKAESAALRMMDDVYRRTILQAETAMSAGAVTLPQAIDLAVKDFLERGITCIEYKDGSRHNITDYVQMALRTAATRSYLQGEAQRREDLGIDTVLVSQYGQCSETCLPWQGRVYIDDVWGSWNGERAGDRGKSVNGKWYPLLSVAVKNGLFHPNCRHTLSTWYEGISTVPEPMDAKKIRRDAALEQKQRAIERNIRRLKRLSEGTQEPEKAKEYRRQVKQAQKELRDIIAEHDDVLRRDYWREKTYGVPEVEKPAKTAILRDINTDYLPVTNAAIQRVPLLKSSLLTDQQNKELRKKHRDLLRYVQEDAVGTEAVASYDMQLTELNCWKGTEEGKVKPPRESVPYMVIHNHPSDGILAVDDLLEMLRQDNLLLITAIGNAGHVSMMERLPNNDPGAYLGFVVQEAARKSGWDPSPEEWVEFTEHILKAGKDYGFRFIR